MYLEVLWQEKCIYGRDCPVFLESLHAQRILGLQLQDPAVSSPTGEYRDMFVITASMSALR